MDWKSVLFSFAGRLNRGKYWLVILINVIVWLAFAIIALTLGAGFEQFGSMGGVGLAAGLIGLAAIVFSIWTGLASAVKRLHDREKSGWWILLFWVVPAILNIVASTTMADLAGIAVTIVSFGISLWGFIEIACLKGTTGPNAYGPDPLPAAAHA